MTSTTAGVRCPVSLCHRENVYGAEVCAGCRTPLSGYARLHTHPALLFNRGLAAAREGRLAAARDCFAAVVHWCPTDTEARNALALAALALADPTEAHHQWTQVLTHRPSDPKATRGLAHLAHHVASGGAGEPPATTDGGTVAEPGRTVEPGGTEEWGEAVEPGRAMGLDQAPEVDVSLDLEPGAAGAPGHVDASGRTDEPGRVDEPGRAGEVGSAGSA